MVSQSISACISVLVHVLVSFPLVDVHSVNYASSHVCACVRKDVNYVCARLSREWWCNHLLCFVLQNKVRNNLFKLS